MTYHPIDKPTEPGWYWWQQPNKGTFWPELIELHDGRLQQWNQRDGGHDDIVDGWGQWFGPVIQPPQKYEAKMAPEIPSDIVDGKATRDIAEGEVMSVSLSEYVKLMRNADCNPHAD